MNISIFKLFKTILVVGVLLCTSISCAFATNIIGLRSFHNDSMTRVVLDLNQKPDYKTSFSANKVAFNIRVHNVDNRNAAPNTVNISNKSCVQTLSKRLDGKDVRYLFSLKGCDTPKTFVLAPQSNNKNYRLVIDFPNASGFTKTNVTSKSTPAVSSVASNGIDTSKSLKTLEKELFDKYSTTSKDGFKTMTPQNAALYNQQLTKLRSDYKKAVSEVNTKKNSTKTTKVATKTTQPKQEVEEIVSDTAAPPVPVKVTSVSKPFIIAVDAGHGGKDPGAIGKRGVREKNVTLAIARALYNYINSDKNFRGTLTRSSDIFIDLDRRSEIARRRKADLLISIHADSVASGSSTARGASVLVLNDSRASRENSKVIRNGKQTQMIGGVSEVMDQSVGNPYLATAVLDMSSTNSRSEGDLLAKEILRKLASFTHVRKTTPIKASLAVLKSPDIPSLLIETGYLSNRYEEIQLNQPNYQKQIAYHIYLGIKSYYEKYPAKKIQSRRESYNRTQKLANKRSVTVKKGQSLSIIAKQNKTTVSALKKLNNLKTDTVHVGQVIYLP